MSGGFRVSIPSNVRKTIQNIKEIAGNHSDEEVYAMLKECAMDPNETAQRLLLQDTFHEVKRKRDKRKENIREPADSRWRPGVQGRGGRSGRGNYSSRYASNDIVGERNVTSGKENGVNQGTEGANKSFSSVNPDTENKSLISISSSIPGLANGPGNVDHPISSQECSLQVSGVSQIASKEESSATGTNKTGKTSLISDDVKTSSASGQFVPGASQSVPSKAATVSGVYASSSDPVLMPSLDPCNPGEVGTIKRVVGSQWTVVEATNKAASRDISGPDLSSVGGKSPSAISRSSVHGRVQIRSQGSRVNQLSDTSHAASSSLSGPPGSRLSSTYNSRSQQLTDSQKVVANKEWKPKSTHTNPAQASGTPVTCGVSTVVEAVTESLPVPGAVASENTTLKLEKRLDELQLSDRQHVIIPNHLQVPEFERHGLNFGSFDSSFNPSTGSANGTASDKSTMPPSESSQEIEEDVEDASSSSHDASPDAQEVDYPDRPQSSTQVPENFSTRAADISSSVPPAPEYVQSKQEAAMAPEGPQYSAVHTAPSYSALGLVPQMLGSQLAPFESSESQARDTTCVPNFVQPFDPSSSYYTQFYRPTADAEGRFSPFLAPGATAKYNGNIAVLPAHTGQAAQESGNSVVLSTVGSTSLSAQAVGVMQSCVPVPQQPVPVFRQPAGVPISHYTPNYIPYNQYFSPFYVPPPALHHFLSNAAFPQQPPTGSVYPPPGASAAATPVKYSISQYKPGTNTGNSNLVGIPTGYGTYSSSPAGYTPNPAGSIGNSTGNEDLTASQFKENNVYMPGQQQSEGSAVWIPAAAARDISSLQASSFYTMPPQGQHMTLAPTQAGHGGLSGIYHPTPTVAAAAVHPLLQQSQTVAGAVEMVGPPSGVYQQPQRAQVNWTNNY
ncbi:GBF-interacting protein 1-like isoform X2 [Phoenix dactylifera]|uniref:GBF-interacting protein 1-like isoform X2 n=1 Tax=Phoenix dactylifera TaxID=42345 RepID=A0A8B7BQ06_PHODC|nr:GBF-interacting protein 1-like isoform X2 [Phoenix dactylifera]